MKMKRTGLHRWLIIWLGVGLMMVFIQILLGGITRLTGSGLSITRWEIVTGTFPPMNDRQWNAAFELYKETPQYRQINEGMSKDRFQFIYFWEYVHRLWARLMGVVFLIPLLYFLNKKAISRITIHRLILVISLAAVAAVFGWVMVASGLVDRPWVNAYKLTIHLSLGIALFLALFYAWIKERGIVDLPVGPGWRKTIRILAVATVLQVILGGMVSGMKSAMLFPTWPTMNGQWIPSIILEGKHWNADGFLLYDESGFMPALVQFLHRNLAYLICLLGLAFTIKWLSHFKGEKQDIGLGLLIIILVQVGLGIITVMRSIGSIPVLYGVLHQGMGIVLLTYLFWLLLKTNPGKHYNSG